MSYINTVIIGSGPAGITTAIYLKRAGISVVLLEKNIPGGLVNMASDIENYPGYEKIDGPSLAMNMFSQVMANEIEFKNEEVIKVELKDKKIVTTNNNTYECDNIVIATGRTSKMLGLPNEKKLLGKGVSLCALCDGNFFKNKDVAVVGGGNSALTEALYLSNLASKVYLIHRRDEFRAEKYIVDKVKNNEKIELVLNSNVTSLKEDEGLLTGITVKTQDEEKDIEVKGIFVYIGYTPATKIFQELGVDNSNGYIIVDENMETNIKGIYACGDVINKSMYQIVTATGEGATVAHSIISNR